MKWIVIVKNFSDEVRRSCSLRFYLEPNGIGKGIDFFEAQQQYEIF